MSQHNDESVRLQYAPIELRKSSLRQTPNSDFGVLLQRGLGKGSAVIRSVAGSAGYHLPGGAIVGAAVQEMGLSRDLDGGSGISAAGQGPSLASAGGAGNFLGAVQQRASGGDASAQMMMATHHMQELNQQFNLGYLQLQQTTQNDSRRFTAISNVMKTKHDTARNSLSNLK